VPGVKRAIDSIEEKIFFARDFEKPSNPLETLARLNHLSP
jgi:hypothetical protein